MSVVLMNMTCSFNLRPKWYVEYCQGIPINGRTNATKPLRF